MPPLTNLAGKRVLVTGAAGFLGRHVIRIGLEQGAAVTAVDRAELLIHGVESVVADVRDGDKLLSIFRHVRPHGIIHLAACGVEYGSGGILESLDVNTLGLARVLAASVELDTSPAVVCAGSGFEYCPKNEPLREGDAVAPVSAYGVSKAASTLVAGLYASRLSITVLRLFGIYGPGEGCRRLAPYIIAQSRRGAPVELTAGEQLRDFSYVGDVAESFWRALVAGGTPGQLQVLNVASGIGRPLRVFIETLAEVLRADGHAPELRFGARPYRDDEIMNYTADISRMRGALDWVPSTSLRAGMAQMVRATNELEG